MSSDNITTIVVALIAAIPASVIAFFAYKAANSAKTEVRDVGLKVDGRLTQLLVATNAASRAEGVTAGLAGNTVVPDPPTQPINGNGFTVEKNENSN